MCRIRVHPAANAKDKNSQESPSPVASTAGIGVAGSLRVDAVNIQLGSPSAGGNALLRASIAGLGKRILRGSCDELTLGTLFVALRVWINPFKRVCSSEFRPPHRGDPPAVCPPRDDGIGSSRAVATSRFSRDACGKVASWRETPIHYTGRTSEYMVQAVRRHASQTG